MPGHPCRCRICKSITWETHAILTEVRRQSDWTKGEIIDYAIRRLGYSWGILDAEYDRAQHVQAKHGSPSRRRRNGRLLKAPYMVQNGEQDRPEWKRRPEWIREGLKWTVRDHG